MRRRFILLCGIFGFSLHLISATPFPYPSDSSVQTVSTAMKPASELISRQEGPKVFPDVLALSTNAPVSILVSLSTQRAYLLVGGKTAVDTPISSGKRNGWTPKREFVILEKDPNHESNLYGNFVDKAGRVVRSGISSKLDVAPSGTHYHGAAMKYFMRLTPEGIGLHVGILPGYPASHGCIRLPLEMAKLIYNTVELGTPVTVAD